MVLEGAIVSISTIFPVIGEIVSGVVDGGLTFLSTMWANPFGQIAIGMGLAGTVIGVGKSLYTRKHSLR